MEIENKKGEVIFTTPLNSLVRANLCGADLCGADLCGADLCGADLREANLREANLREANLCGANLREANLREANLREADLREANLCGANLREADLREANLCGADLCGADLCGADLYGAKYRDETILKLLLMSNVDGSGRLIYVYICEKETYVRAGCFNSTLKQFKEKAAKEGKLIYANAVPAFVEAVKKELKK